MKRTTYKIGQHIIFVVIAAFVSLNTSVPGVFGSATTTRQSGNPNIFPESIKQEIHAISLDHDSIFIESLPIPHDTKQTNVAGDVPIGPIKEAVRWLKRVVAPTYLPKDIETAFEAFSQVTRLEYRNRDGTLADSWKGDYFVIDNLQDATRPSYISENGDSVNISVKLSSQSDISTDESVKRLLIANLTGILMFPQNEVPNIRFVIFRTKDIVYGRMTTWQKDPDVGEIIDNPDKFRFWWWENIRFLTDGSGLFLGVSEANHEPVHIQEHSGLPERFSTKPKISH